MKLQAYQLCRWCDAALHGRRKWLWLAVNVLTLTLSAIIGRWFLPVLSILLLANAALALYVLHRHHAFGTAYQRTPRPSDAQCETILIDAALIGEGTRLRAAAQPIDTAESLSMRLGSGALLLGTAMTLTADELPPADRAAILSAVQQLNIKPDRMRSHSPLLRREKKNGLSVVTVRDGLQERRYYLGAPADVAKECVSIWEGHPRPMAEDDPRRIEDTAGYIAQGNCRLLAWATALGEEAPIFLGMCGVGESVRLQAMQDVAALRNQGLTVMLAPGNQPDTDLEALRALLDLPDHHARADVHLSPNPLPNAGTLGIRCTPDDSLLETVMQLRRRFRTMEETLRRFTLLMSFVLLTTLLCGGGVLALPAAALMLCTAIFIGVDLDAPRPGLPLLILCAALAMMAGLFLKSQSNASALLAGGMITLATTAAAALQLGGKGFLPLLARLPAVPVLLTILGGILLAAVMLCGFLASEVILPLLFSVLVSAAIFLLICCEHKILR